MNKVNQMVVDAGLSKAVTRRSSRHSNAVAGPSNLGKRKSPEDKVLSSPKSKKKIVEKKNVTGTVGRILRNRQAQRN